MNKQVNISFEYIITYMIETDRKCDLDRVVKKMLPGHVTFELRLGV